MHTYFFMFRDKSLKKLLKILGLLWISYPAYAATTYGINQQQSYHPPKNHLIHKYKPTTSPIQQRPQLELSLLLGGTAIPNTIHGQTLQLLPYEIGPDADTFTKQSGSGAFTWGLDAKYRFKLHELFSKNYIFDAIGVGIDFFQIAGSTQTGHVYQFNMPEFENYTYKLKLNSNRVMADVDLDFHPILNIIPFIEGGIGGAVTQVSYNSAPIAPVEGPNFTLPSRSTWTFAYQAGAGLKYVVSNHFALSFHYLYADMGNVKSSTSGSAAMLASPLTVKMHTQNFMLGLTYIVK